MPVQCFFIVLQIFSIFAMAIAGGRPHCYFLKILGMRTTESPHYRFEMTMHKNLTLSSVSRVLQEVPTPVWHIRIIQHSKSNSTADKQPTNTLLQQGPKQLYNGTYKTCDFWKYAKRIRVFSNVAQMVLSKDSTNLSLNCPMPVGTYVIRKIYVPPDTGLLRFMYFPNTVYTLYGTVYSQRPDKSLEKLCSYEINGTVFKNC